MKYSYKLSDAIHLLSYLSIYQDGDLSSKAIANSIQSNPSIIRKLMSDLKKRGLITTHQGKAKPKLSKDPQSISIYDIFAALDIDHHFLHPDPKTDEKCIVGGNIRDALNEAYKKIEDTAFKEMKQMTLQDIIDGILNREEKRKK